MNERDVLKQSIKVFIIGLIIFSLIGVILKSIAYPLGFALGYVINVIIFNIIIKTSDLILNIGHSISMIVIMSIIKLLLYALGFLLAIFFKDILSIIGVFFGYMVIKITINIMGYLTKEVKENE
ncbi:MULTISPECIES: hypothetical protein [Coprobacillaceae]|uniref:hypothetical protein n=1 Tax=Coprobacillaceae TaxID=2810280 RepID=UPI000E548B04|nr:MULTISPECIES: hypothetical protein [Coprobacillaceae]RHM58912.1 hypothetical protein DWZ53_10675 [Coprobacillus sp. AF33-1AC]RHS91775.1 hypothetical protein DW911_09495 [Erysipelatoclostridium sp. AM42-17]